MNKNIKKIIIGFGMALMVFCFTQIVLGALADNIVYYAKLDGNSNDAVGSNDGTDTNITYGDAYGKINNGALFNDTPDSYITKSSPTGLPTGNVDLSINVWMNPRVNPNTGSLIAFGAEATNEMAGVGLDSAGFLWIGYSNDANVAYSYATSTWTMVTATYTAADKTVRFYANASLIDTAQTLTNTPNVGSVFLIFGKQRPNNVAYFDGMMDEGGIWDKVLTTDEITELYNDGAGLQYPFTIPQPSIY